MTWFGKVTFGSLGLFLGGPLGAVIGATLGHHLVDKKQQHMDRQTPLGRQETAQAAYFVCMFSILGKLAKIDGTVSREEIAVVEDFISKLNIPVQEQQFAKQIFSEAKYSQYSIEDFAVQFYQIHKQQPTVLISFIEVLFQVAAADKHLHPAEESALKSIKNIFRISDQQFKNIKARYFDSADKYYQCLNCTPESSNEEIKKNYRKLVKDFHPDTIISKGLPAEFTEFATKRFQEIQSAYEHIKKERGL